MARKPVQSRIEDRSSRDKIVDALMALLAERRIEEIDFVDIAGRAGVPLAECRAEFGSVLAVIAAHAKAVDQQVLAAGIADVAEEPPRERLFDVLMRRLEVLAPDKPAVRSLMRSAMRNPGLALALNGMTVRSIHWMMNAAGISAAGLTGMLRAQGLAVLYASVLRTWLNDDDPGLARTLAALDRELSRGARLAGLLEDLGRLAPRRCCRRMRSRRRPERDLDEEPAAA